MGMSAVVQSGSFKVVEDASGKSIECVSAGEISFEQPHSYGQWEWEMYDAVVANVQTVMFVSDLPTIAGGTGMGFLSRWSNRVKATRNITGVQTGMFYTDVNYFPVSTWVRCKVTRTLDNEYKYFMNGS